MKISIPSKLQSVLSWFWHHLQVAARWFWRWTQPGRAWLAKRWRRVHPQLLRFGVSIGVVVGILLAWQIGASASNLYSSVQARTDAAFNAEWSTTTLPVLERGNVFELDYDAVREVTIGGLPEGQNRLVMTQEDSRVPTVKAWTNNFTGQVIVVGDRTVGAADVPSIESQGWITFFGWLLAIVAFIVSIVIGWGRREVYNKKYRPATKQHSYSY